MSKLREKVALVTGASRGIGRAVATLLASEQAHVVVNYLHSEDDAKHTLSLINAPGLRHSLIQADISKAEEVKRLVTKVESDYGRLDILVNNAGINRDATLFELTEEMWDRVVDTNLKGPFLCSKLGAALMLKSEGGSIINISAESALVGRVGACNYTAAKAGLVGLTKSLAKELAPHIRVNCLALGLIHTDEVTSRLGLDREPKLGEFLRAIPLRRLGAAEEVARVALFLASEDSSYVTGQVLAVGGGRWM